MSIAHLLNCTGQTYRLTETVDDLAEARNTYVAHGSPLGARITPAGGSLGSTAAGQRPAGQRVLYLDGHPDIQATDLFDITAGPDAGSRWRVLVVDRPSPPGFSVAHHTECAVEPHTGVFP